MRTQTGVLFTAGLLLSWLASPIGGLAAAAENEGQADLDRAIELKLSAETLAEWGTVIDLCQSALNKGLDKENEEFCKQLFASTLMQRAEQIGTKLFQMGPDDLAVQGAVAWRMAVKDIDRSLDIDPTQATAQLWRGKLQAMQWGDRKTARNAFNQAVRLAGDDNTIKAEALRWRAQIRENLDERLKDLSEAITLTPQSGELLRLRGATYLGAANPDAALADFDAALAIDADDVEAHEGRGLTLESLKRYDEARASYSRAAELVPGNLFLLLQRARASVLASKHEQALADFDAALTIDADNKPALEGRALSLEALKRYDDLRETYGRVAQLEPGNAVPLLQQARASALAEKHEQAIEDVERALEVDPDNLFGLLLKAQTLALMNRAAEAVPEARRALDLQPDSDDAVRVWAMVIEKAGKTQSTIKELRQQVEANPDDAVTWLQLGLLYSAQKQSGKAIDAYSAAIKINPREFAYQVRADTYLNHGKQKEAIADYEDALKIAPTNSGVLNNLAWVLATSPEAPLRNGERALELAIQACEVTNYEQAHILSTLAAAYAEKGDFKAARKWSAKSVELGEEALKDQLRKELASYEKEEPWREKQGVSEDESQDEN